MMADGLKTRMDAYADASMSCQIPPRSDRLFTTQEPLRALQRHDYLNYRGSSRRFLFLAVAVEVIADMHA